MAGFMIFAMILVAATAHAEVYNPIDTVVQYSYPEPESYDNPQWTPEIIEHPQSQRFRRDVKLNNDGLTVDKAYGRDRVFGQLGSGDNGLYGRAGVERNFFDDGRGKFDGLLHGTRTLGPVPTSEFGGALNWRNQNAAASLDVNKQIHGSTNWAATGGGRWPIGKNGELGLDGTYSRIGGARNFGAQGIFNYRF